MTAFVGQAVHYGREADLDTERLDVKTQESLIMEAKNNYAMALALKRDPGTAKVAEDLTNYLQQRIEKYPEDVKILVKEAIGFVKWRLPRRQNDTFVAAAYLHQTWHKADENQKFLWKKRWKQFSKGKL